jgi:hypothetical protein
MIILHNKNFLILITKKKTFRDFLKSTLKRELLGKKRTGKNRLKKNFSGLSEIDFKKGTFGQKENR